MKKQPSRTVYQRLPWRVRSRILHLLSDGAEANEVLQDQEFTAALESKHLSMTETDILQIRQTEEYHQFMEKISLDAGARTAEKIAASVLENAHAFGNTADIARYELAKLIRELIAEAAADTGSELGDRVKAIRALAQSLSSLSAPVMERKLAVRDTGIAKLQSLLALKNAEILQLRDLASQGNNEKVIEAMNEKVGLGECHEIPAISETLDSGRVSHQTV